jgi:transcriptional regulator with XRE-family HTH domain
MANDRPEWLVRLINAVEAYIQRHGSSLRSISKASGLGDNFLSQLRADGWKEPQFSSVVAICKTINVSIIYIVTGAQMTPEEELFLQRLKRLSVDQQKSILTLLESFPPADERIQ